MVFQKNAVSPVINSAAAAGNGDFGAVGFVSSLSSNTSKQTIVNEMSKLGAGWAREEYTYSSSINFAPYDAAYGKLRAANLNILGLLTYSSGVSHSQWRNYVTTVVNHFPSIPAWEIMNEADNYLSPADYVAFLKEARDIIKAKNSGAKIILSGITARVESPNFWNGVAAAGGWPYFDAAGLHVFHNTDPYHDSYNNGTLAQEIQHAIDSLNHNGGGKKIWLTEFGWDSNKFGTDNQATWFSQGIPIVHRFSEVEKIFIFRMYDQGNGLGLLTSSFAEKPAFNAVKNAISGAGSQVAAPAPAPAGPSTPTPTPVQINKEKSSLRLDPLEVFANGQPNYRIVVLAKDNNDRVITSVKPSIILDGGQTELTDFVLVGNEWFAYVTSTEKGTRTAKVSVGNDILGTLQLSFQESNIPSPIASSSDIPLSTTDKTSKNIPLILFYVISSVLAIGLLAFLFIRRRVSTV